MGSSDSNNGKDRFTDNKLSVNTMFLVLAVALTLNVVHGFEPDLKLDAEGIVDLDESMYKDVTAPEPIKKKVIMKNMMNLFLSLDHIYEQLQEGNENCSEFRKVIEDIKAKNGLKILNMKQDNEKIMEAYGWDEVRVTQLRRNLERACDMWRNIVEVVDKTQPAS